MPSKPASAFAPDAFLQRWGRASLLQLPPTGHLARTLPASSREFLWKAGLPLGVETHEHVHGSGLTFRRLRNGGRQLIEEWPKIGPPAEWSPFWIIGDEYFCQGSAWWVIHDRTGEISRVDPCRDPAIYLVNVDAAHFAQSLLAAVEWTEHCRYIARDWSQQIASLRTALRQVDPPAAASPHSHWMHFTDVIECEPPHPEEPGQSGVRKLDNALERYFSEDEVTHCLQAQGRE
jgi:hypothetical protein